MLRIPDRLLELLRNQVPYAGTDLQSNPAVVFLQELVDAVNALNAEVFEEEEELSS